MINVYSSHIHVARKASLTVTCSESLQDPATELEMVPDRY